MSFFSQLDPNLAPPGENDKVFVHRGEVTVQRLRYLVNDGYEYLSLGNDPEVRLILKHGQKYLVIGEPQAGYWLLILKSVNFVQDLTNLSYELYDDPVKAFIKKLLERYDWHFISTEAELNLLLAWNGQYPVLVRRHDVGCLLSGPLLLNRP